MKIFAEGVGSKNTKQLTIAAIVQTVLLLMFSKVAKHHLLFTIEEKSIIIKMHDTGPHPTHLAAAAAACMGPLMRCMHTQPHHNCGHSSLLSPGWFGSTGGGEGVSSSDTATSAPATTTPGADWWDEILPAKIKRSQCQNNSWYAYLPPAWWNRWYLD